MTVARDVRSAGDSEREVSYRTETFTADDVTTALPVRYENQGRPYDLGLR